MKNYKLHIYKLLIITLTGLFFIKSADAKMTMVYDSIHQRYVPLTQPNFETVQPKYIYPNKDNSRPIQAPYFNNTLAPALGNLGHRAYSDPVDVDQLLDE